MKNSFDYAKLRFSFFGGILIMCCQKVWARILPFTFTFLLGASSIILFQNDPVEAPDGLQRLNSLNIISSSENPITVNPSAFNQVNNFTYRGNGNGIGCSRHNEWNDEKAVRTEDFSNKGLHITSKPRAAYTDPAKQDRVEGIVTLRVTFLSNGKIAGVTPVSTLPDGLTEQAVSAAGQIKFEPAIKDGHPVSVTKQVQYSFTIY